MSEDITQVQVQLHQLDNIYAFHEIRQKYQSKS